MTTAGHPTELEQRRATLSALLADLAAVAPDPAACEALRLRIEDLHSHLAPSLSPGLAFNLKSAVTDGVGSEILATRMRALLSEVEQELATRAVTISYRRSRPRAIAAVVLWIVAGLLTTTALLTGAIGMIAARTRAFEDLARQGFLSLAFYGLLAIAFVLFGAAVWLRGDPRPRPLSSRWLSLLGVVAVLSSLGSAIVTTQGQPLPIISDTQRYEVLGGAASVKSPGAAGWTAKRDKQGDTESVAFSRDVGTHQTAEENETLRARIQAQPVAGNLLPLEDLMQQAIDGQRAGLVFRGTEISFRMQSVAGRSDCRRWDGSERDTAVPQFPGRPFILVGHGIVCISQESFVTVEWSHRYLETTTPVVAETEADAFLASFSFTAVAPQSVVPNALPSAGNRLFVDRFTDAKSGWTLVDLEFGKTSYLPGGGYALQARRDAHFHVGTNLAPRARNVYIEAEFFAPQATDVWFGPTCRVDSSFRAFYGFFLRSDGGYWLQRLTGDGGAALATSVGVRRAIAPPANLRLGLYCVTDANGAVTLVGSVNGVALLRAEDRNGAIDREGFTGFYMNTAAASPQFKLTSFIVSEAR